MAQPVVTSISFDAASYEPGSTITATINYTSSNEHGGAGSAGYSLGVTLADIVNSDTNSGLPEQSAEFFVNSGPVAPNPIDIAVASGLTIPGLSVASLASGNTSDLEFSTPEITAEPNALLILWLTTYPGYLPTVTGLGLTWTSVVSPNPRLTAWTAVTSSAGVLGTVNISLPAGPAYASWDLDQITGQDPATPLITSNTQSGSGDATSSMPSLTFNPASSSSNKFIFGSGGYNIVGPTPSETPTAWSQLASQVAYMSSPTEAAASIETQLSENSSELTAAATWSIYPGFSWGGWMAIGFELNAFQDASIGMSPGPWTLVSNDLASDGSGVAIFQAVA